MGELLEPPAWELLALAFGLIVGSFSNVCVHRLPLEQSVVSPPSRCPGCGAPIKPWDNIPLLSWLLLRGRCRQCRAPISIRYPALEALSGLLYFALARTYGAYPRCVVLMLLVTALLILGLIDLEHQILPNVITRPGIVVGVAVAVGAPFLPVFSPPGAPPWPGWRESLASAVGAYLLFAAIARTAEWYYGEEALGQGDWKLAAMLGAFLGWKQLLVTVFLASLSGTVVGLLLIAAGRGRKEKVPLGTFLALGGILVVFVGTDLWGWYQRLFWEVPRR